MRVRVTLVQVYDFAEEENETDEGPIEIPPAAELHDILMEKFIYDMDGVHEVETADGRLFNYRLQEVIDLKVEEEK